MPLNSRDKGKRGQREVLARMLDLGFASPIDTRQEKKGHNLPDIYVNGVISIEVKYRETFNAYSAIEQLNNDCNTPVHSGNLKCVYHRRNRGAWLAVMEADVFEKLLIFYAERVFPDSIIKPGVYISINDQQGDV